ncbi:glycosyltransferase family 4 protein [Micrococcoides hystricis]|uniref:Glycosyltransferase family 4 protein n=1 Tax=Micrococcoides hystricis TaxID=1572761 RepID=A0ABV6P8R5_9MICC
MDFHDGISRFGATLATELAQHADVTLLIHDERQLQLLPDLPYLVVSAPTSPKELFIWLQLNRHQPDVVFSPMQTMGSWFRSAPLVLTLHDLIYYEHRTPPRDLPAFVRVLWRLYHLAYWPQRLLLNRADLIFTVSETTKTLMSRHRLTKRPVVVTPNAPQEHRYAVTGSPKKTLLYMGSFMEYKNVATLVRAMELLPDYQLHLLSKITPAKRAALEDLSSAPQRIVFHNGVSDAEYEQLLSETTALVHLSQSEGYGMPVIEAMALGVPVLVNDIPIFREVAGEAGIFVDGTKAREVAAAVTMLAEPGLWVEHSKAAFAHAQRYTWARTGTIAATALEKLVGRAGLEPATKGL